MVSVSEQRAGQPPAGWLPALRVFALRFDSIPSVSIISQLLLACCGAAHSGPKKIRQVTTENSKRSLAVCPDSHSSSSHSPLSDSLSIGVLRMYAFHFMYCPQTYIDAHSMCIVLYYSRWLENTSSTRTTTQGVAFRRGDRDRTGGAGRYVGTWVRACSGRRSEASLDRPRPDLLADPKFAANSTVVGSISCPVVTHTRATDPQMA